MKKFLFLLPLTFTCLCYSADIVSTPVDMASVITDSVSILALVVASSIAVYLGFLIVRRGKHLISYLLDGSYSEEFDSVPDEDSSESPWTAKDEAGWQAYLRSHHQSSSSRSSNSRVGYRTRRSSRRRNYRYSRSYRH